MRQKRDLRNKGGLVLKSKLVISILIFIIISLATAIAGDVIFKEGTMDIAGNITANQYCNATVCKDLSEWGESSGAQYQFEGNNFNGSGNITTTDTGTFGGLNITNGSISDFNPQTNIIQSLGSSAKRWLKGWFKDLDVSGNLNVTGNVTASFYNGINISKLGGNPFNQVLNTTSNVTFRNITATGHVNVAGNVTARQVFAGNSTKWISLGWSGSQASIDTTATQITLNNKYLVSQTGTAIFDTFTGNTFSGGVFSGSGFTASGNSGVTDTYDDGTDTQITFTGGIATAISTSFDEKLMTNIVYLGNNPNTTLTPISFKWNEEGLKQFSNQSEHIGKLTGYYKAQDVQKFYPDCIVNASLKEIVNGTQIITNETAITYNRNCVAGMLSQELGDLKSTINKICANQPLLCK